MWEDVKEGRGGWKKHPGPRVSGQRHEEGDHHWLRMEEVLRRAPRIPLAVVDVDDARCTDSGIQSTSIESPAKAALLPGPVREGGRSRLIAR